MPEASTTSTTGQPVRRDRSAAEPRPSGAPSNSPITPSTTMADASRCKSVISADRVPSDMDQVSRLWHVRPLAAA